MNLLTLQDIKMSFYDKKGETKVLEDFSMDIKEHSINAIIGPSGCGKSTILNLISGLIKPCSGKLIINGEIGYMFQKDNLFPWLTILENVAIGLKIRKKWNAEAKEYAISLLEKYGLGEFINRYPAELSGGMRQRAALIRVLVINPDVLLLDEPFSALDAQTRLAVGLDIFNIIKAEKKTTIIVTHDISEAIAMADYIFILSSRPARVKEVVKVELSVEPKNPLSARKASEFRYYFDMLWSELA